jgi:hypothetical protein
MGQVSCTVYTSANGVGAFLQQVKVTQPGKSFVAGKDFTCVINDGPANQAGDGQSLAKIAANTGGRVISTS